ncbi:hypothetical protein [Vibrio casei]|nr:hypothetical protein [Vibrio casei]
MKCPVWLEQITSDPTNKAIIEKNKVLKKINAKYGMMVDDPLQLFWTLS